MKPFYIPRHAQNLKSVGWYRFNNNKYVVNPRSDLVRALLLLFFIWKFVLGISSKQILTAILNYTHFQIEF